jgi:flagellum-specific peptidoglycan hydrolase FlgJ
MPDKPMVGQEDRPDLTVNTEGTTGSQPRDLGTILGSSAAAPKLKEVGDKPVIKETLKDALKDHKDSKDHKEQKDHKEPKDHKDSKDNKDQKDQKDPKEHKDQKDQKDPKEHKDQKDQKDHKDPKEHKDQKDLKDHKETIKEIKDGAAKETKEFIDVAAKSEVETGPAQEGLPPNEMAQLIKRISGLEQAIEDLKRKK